MARAGLKLPLWKNDGATTASPSKDMAKEQLGLPSTTPQPLLYRGLIRPGNFKTTVAARQRPRQNAAVTSFTRRRDPDRADCRNFVSQEVTTMARHLFLAITLIGIGGLLNSPAQAMTPVRCDDQAARCSLCTNPHGGAYPSNKCLSSCDWKVTACLVRAHDAARRWGR